ncbi:hypothetical protein NDU88_004398 [Pleurodeles waltl]|uniref:Reverse transcriptase domain-containing protein n=1 Tax=Pleurodeles waltl TaxID=8319 RepID=A0AAV7NTK9_PLEWA|nr:hypothetical protein NDU88_004398 [Pleurodeles waltl]
MNPSSAPDIAIAIPDGYKIIRRDRFNRTGGGIAIAHKSSISISTHTDNSLPDAEHLHFVIHIDPKTTLRGTLMYRPPGPRTKFSEDIADFVNPHALSSTDYILLGDLNFHLENHTDNNTTAVLDNLANLGLKQLVNTPTHYAGHTLDPIFSSSKHITFSHTTERTWSDHSCVHFNFKKTTVHHHTRQPPKRHWNRITTEQLAATLSLNQPTSTSNPNEAANNLTNWISNCANLLAPLKTQTNTNNHKKNSWFTTELKNSKKECRLREKTWRLNPTEENLTALKDTTRQHHQRLRTARKTAYQNRLDNNAHNSKELFGIVKELSNPDAETNPIPPSQDLCDSLATFFHRKIADIYNSITTTNMNPPPEAANDISTILAWNPTTTEETTRVMNSIHSGSPSDPCPHHIYNKADNIIAPHLRDVINASLTTATFPESWKHAELNALLKKPTADPTELKNFRPISLLPFPAKVIEKIVNAQLTAALESSDSLDSTQFGFRANHSTETALIAATNDIRALTDKGETVALILLDLSAAFDTVCHRTLIDRLGSAGIRGKALEWVISFLSGRTQRVRLPPFRSAATEIICGVPQGSSLSPTLFNVYMTPLANIARKHGLDIISYADDTQLILSLTNNPTSARTRLHDGMKEVATWMTDSRLKLNTDKTEVLILGPTPSAWDDSWWPPALGSTPQPTNHARNLGFILDSSLSMTRQVNSVTSACFNTLRMLRKIFRWIPIDTRKTVTHALVTSRLDYGNTLYAGITTKLQRKLQRIQNAAARLILDIPRHHHISGHLRKLHWLPVNKRITFRLLTHAHKALYNLGPKLINSRVSFYTPPRTLRSTGQALAAVPRIRKTTAGGKSFSFLAAKTWNSLPSHLRGYPNTSPSEGSSRPGSSSTDPLPPAP